MWLLYDPRLWLHAPLRTRWYQFCLFRLPAQALCHFGDTAHDLPPIAQSHELLLADLQKVHLIEHSVQQIG